MNKNTEKIVLRSVYLMLVMVVVCWLRWAVVKGRIEEQLMVLLPRFLFLNFCLILLAVWLNRRTIAQKYSDIPREIKKWLAVVILTGVFLASLAAPRTHRIFYDEDIYLNTAQNIVYEGKAAAANEAYNEYGEYHLGSPFYNKEPIGFPFVVSLIFRVFGVHELYAHLLNNFLFGLAVLVVFWIAAEIFEDHWAGIYAALIYALTPQNLIWANTTSAEISSALFAALPVLAAVWYVKSSDPRLLFLTVLLSAFGCQFRPESGLILGVCFLIVAIFSFRETRKTYFWWMMAVLVFLLVPHLVHLLHVKDLDWGSSSSKFSIGYFLPNLKVNGLFYFNNKEFPLLYTLLAAAGFVVGKNVRWKGILLSWFILFWGIFLFFYAGSYNYGADDRFSLLSHAPLALFAGYGLREIFRKKFFHEHLCGNEGTMGKCGLLVIFLIFCQFFPFVRALTQEAWQSRADHRYARMFLKDIPPHSIVLSHDPTMFLLWGQSAGQLSTAQDAPAHVYNNLFSAYPGGVYAHLGYWCNVPNKTQNPFCEHVRNHYDTTLIKQYNEGGFSFELLKIHHNKDGKDACSLEGK